MALFKKPSTIEEIRKAYQDLSDEDKKKFEQSIKDRVDESVGEQEKESGDEDTQNAKDRVDESEGMERVEKKESEKSEDKPFDERPDEEREEESTGEQEAEDERDEAQSARITALEETVAKLAEQLEAFAGRLDDKPFGKSPAAPSERTEDKDDDRIMRNYYGRSRY